MSDRELLEMAARAAGINLLWDGDNPKEVVQHWSGNPEDGGETRDYGWNPLDDDGAALRLAVDLQLLMNIGTEATFANNKVNGEQDKWAREQHKDSDPLTATRRAIVRAAAEIGKAMP